MRETTRETAEEIASRLERLARRMRRAGSEQLCDLDVTPGQVRVLRVISHTDGPLRVKELAERLDVVPRSATSAVDELEEAGLVQRSADERDRRATLVSLTVEGQKVLQTLRRRRRDSTLSLLDELSRAEQQQLLALLDKVVPDCRGSGGQWSGPHRHR